MDAVNLAPPIRRCNRCDKQEGSEHHLLECMRCKLVVYCNRECQVAHWKAGHKKVCGKSPLSSARNPISKKIYHEIVAHIPLSPKVDFRGDERIKTAYTKALETKAKKCKYGPMGRINSPEHGQASQIFWETWDVEKGPDKRKQIWELLMKAITVFPCHADAWTSMGDWER